MVDFSYKSIFCGHKPFYLVGRQLKTIKETYYPHLSWYLAVYLCLEDIIPVKVWRNFQRCSQNTTPNSKIGAHCALSNTLMCKFYQFWCIFSYLLCWIHNLIFKWMFLTSWPSKIFSNYLGVALLCLKWWTCFVNVLKPFLCHEPFQLITRPFKYIVEWYFIHLAC